MELQTQELILGGGLAVLLVDKFIQYAKIIKVNTVDRKNGKTQHSDPCKTLQSLDEKYHSQREQYLEDRGNMQSDITEIKTNVKWMKKQLENGIKFTGDGL